MKKTPMKMKKGFMCQSTEVATAVCMANDTRSVIVPRRPDRTIFDDTRLVDNAARYSRLVESHNRFVSAANKRSVPVIVPSSTRREQDVIKFVNPSTRRSSVQDLIKQEPKNIQNPAPLASSGHVFQVVVMRVSLHCQGCAGKVKKHLSKMEGVTSFSIDLESKRVTVMGHVSPDGVLESISKVKKAEFWNC